MQSYESNKQDFKIEMKFFYMRKRRPKSLKFSGGSGPVIVLTFAGWKLSAAEFGPPAKLYICGRSLILSQTQSY